MPKPKEIANQAQRQEHFNYWRKRMSKIVLIRTSVVLSLMGLLSVFFQVHKNNNIMVIYIISIFLAGILSTSIFAFKMKRAKKEIISYMKTLFYAMPIGLCLIHLFLVILVSYLSIPHIENYIIRFHLFFILAGVVSYFLIKNSWERNWAVNSQLLMKEKPYIRIFPENADAVIPSNLLEYSLSNTIPIPCYKYCILFPFRVTKKNIKRKKMMYKEGDTSGQKMLLFFYIPMNKGTMILAALGAVVGSLWVCNTFLQHLVIYQKLRQIEKKEGITFLPYFMKPQEEVDAENGIVET